MPANHQARGKGAKVTLDQRRVRATQFPRHGKLLVRDTRLGRTAADANLEGSAKETLAFRLNELLDENGLSQSAAAQLLGMPQPKVSAIRNYKLRGISLVRLIQALLALNQQVEIVVKPGRKAGSGAIRVAV